MAGDRAPSPALGHDGVMTAYWVSVYREITDEGKVAAYAELAGPALCYRRGRYYYVPAGTPRMQARVRRDQRCRQLVARAVRSLVRRRRAEASVMVDRRARPRFRFVHSARLHTADGRVLHVLIRDISLSGLRLLGSCPLDGEEVQVWVPLPDAAEPPRGFAIRILWSAPVGDGLFESGGVFVDVID